MAKHWKIVQLISVFVLSMLVSWIFLRNEPRVEHIAKSILPVSTRENYVNRTPLPGRHPTLYLCFKPGGRLGNQIFGYASAFSIARSKGMELVHTGGLRDIFKLSSSCETQIDLWGEICETAPKLHQPDNVCNAFDEMFWKKVGNQTVRYVGCLRSWKYLIGHEQPIRKELTFRSHIQSRARSALLAALGNRQIDTDNRERVLVAIHVRRGDRLHIEGLPVPEKEYFIKAMSYMRKKFSSVTFVICSEDIHWSKQHLYSSDTVFVDTGKAELDFAVLSMCNHTIMSVGTFGWWAAWLANGTTIYYREQFKPGSGNAAHTSMTEYIPPHWIAME